MQSSEDKSKDQAHYDAEDQYLQLDADIRANVRAIAKNKKTIAKMKSADIISGPEIFEKMEATKVLEEAVVIMKTLDAELFPEFPEDQETLEVSE